MAMSKTAKTAILMLLGITLLVACAVGFVALRHTDQSNNALKMQTSLIDDSTLTKLATKNIPIDRSHLADGVAPPTNKWFSGFALQSDPKPGYNYPNSFLPRSDGFEFSLPKIRAERTIITGTHTADVVVSIDSAESYKLTSYDELVVELTYYDSSNNPVATVHVASGLPYVYVAAKQDTSVRFSGTTTPRESGTSIRSNDTLYGVNVRSNDNRFSLASGKSVGFFSAPTDDAYATVAAHAGTTVQSGQASYKRQGDNIRTTLTYQTAQNQPVLFARLPHQQSDASPSLGTYQSVLGDLAIGTGRELSFSTPVVPVTEQLDLSGISDADRNLLVRQLRNDIRTFDNKDDTYFGGKQLYRMAQLLTIANQLNESTLAETARATLSRELGSWLTPGKDTPKSFLYEPSMHGLVGNKASFGSDKEFNDHHFHYGYFIYAAATLARYDQDFLAENKKTVNLLVADIANYNADEKLPLRRSFDPYAGHSWASGIVPYADGNNQESTSEAINAWVGVSLWAHQTDNDALGLQADWMLSQEYRTAQLYWLMDDKKQPTYLAAYESPLASIVWGGKREYATFFSDDPNAKLAIQLLPLSPTIKHLKTSYAADLFGGTSVNRTYGDQILMARPDATVEQAVDLPDSAIDDGNSRTYLYAYILAR